jgi:hypothetical protein
MIPREAHLETDATNETQFGAQKQERKWCGATW